MKKSFGKAICVICLFIILFTMNNDAFAKNNSTNKKKTNSPIYYEAISQYTGVSVEELKKIEAEYGDLTKLYGIYIDEEKTDDMNPASSGSDGNVVPMTQTQYDNLLRNLAEGDILVTKDAWSSFVNHGHCCIVDDVNSIYSVYVVEAFEPGVQSDRYQLGNEHNHWRNYNRVRVYYPTNTTTAVRSAAANYACNNLQDLNYDALANVYSSTKVNCATLIWKAYDSEDVRLRYSFVPFKYTVFPDDIVHDPENTMKCYVNWSGDAHTW